MGSTHDSPNHKKIPLTLLSNHELKEGSPINYEGEYDGKKYHDKGIIKKNEPGKLLQSTYWSSMAGKEDIPEN